MLTFNTHKAPLHMEVKREILRAIESNELGEDGKLPSEEVLSKMFNVSRSTIRSALQSLETDGIISIRHGIGSFINPTGIMGMRMRIDQARGFFHLISDSGHTPSISDQQLKHGKLNEKMCQALNLPEGSEAVLLQRMFLGDGKPAFFITEYLPSVNLAVQPKSEQMPESIFQIAEKYCRENIEYALTELSAVAVSADLKRKMKLKEKSALLKLDEVYFTNDNKPIIYSEVYVNDDMIHFQIQRKKPY